MVIDDDAVHNMVCTLTIQKSGLSESVNSYTSAADALDIIKGLIERGGPLPDVIFLDINMPVMDGWAFLEAFEQLPYEPRQHTQVYMLSSSLYPEDIQRAKSYSTITEYITKPLTFSHLDQIKAQYSEAT